MFRSAVLAVVLSLTFGVAAWGAGGDPAAWKLHAGVFETSSSDPDQSVYGDVEYRFRTRAFRIFPVVGLLANGDGGLYGRVGLGRDFHFGGRWTATLSLSGGYYEQGDSKDLGNELEFRSAGELGYTLRDGLRLGLAYAHISNASTSEVNPGVETLGVVLTVFPGARR